MGIALSRKNDTNGQLKSSRRGPPSTSTAHTRTFNVDFDLGAGLRAVISQRFTAPRGELYFSAWREYSSGSVPHSSSEELTVTLAREL